MAQIVNGKLMAREIKESLRAQIAEHNLTNICFDIIYVGSDPVIDNFIKYKKVFGEDLGVTVKVHNLAVTVTQDELLTYINKVQETAQAVIVQLPLPDHLDQGVILDSVHARKDVDVLGREAKEGFKKDTHNFFPPVTGSIVYILNEYNISLENKKILLIGNGALVGYPMSLWLDRSGYSYDIIVKETEDGIKKKLIIEADVIISGAGVPHMITTPMVKEGVVLVDAGTSESGKKIIGDIHPECSKQAALLTPVPGGIGPMTIAVLYQNILKSYLNHYDK